MRCWCTFVGWIALAGRLTHGQVAATNVTTAELEYAAALGVVGVTSDVTTFSGLGPGIGKWRGIAYASSVDMLFAAPFNADAVLTIDPRTNAIDNSTLGGLGTGGDKWSSIAYASSVDLLYAAPNDAHAVLIVNPRTNVTDGTTLGGLGTGILKWGSIAYAPSVDMLFAAPFNANAVLVINPQTNVTDTTTLGGFGTDSGKWRGIAYVPSVDMLFAAPNSADAVLMINPRTNVTDNTTLSGLGVGGNKWSGIAYASSADMLFAAPYHADVVLMVNPRTNVTDITTLGGLGTGEWIGITYVPSVDMLFAAPFNAEAVLRINPLANSTEITTLHGRPRAFGGEWLGIAFAPSVDVLFAAPCNADTVLTVRFVVDNSVVAPLRQITELTNMLGSLQSELVSSEATHVSTQQAIGAALLSSQVARLTMQASLSSSDAARSAMRAELSTIGNTGCNRPVCAAGTRPESGACVPDCTDLERRGISCEPYCDAADATPGRSEPSPAGLIVGVALGGVLVFAIAVAVCRRRAVQRELFVERPMQPQVMAMVVNPMHQSNMGTTAPNVDSLQSSTVGEMGSQIAVLDDEMYVAQTASNVGDYAVFQSDQVRNSPQYHVFKDIQSTSVDRDETA